MGWGEEVHLTIPHFYVILSFSNIFKAMTKRVSLERFYREASNAFDKADAGLRGSKRSTRGRWLLSGAPNLRKQGCDRFRLL